MNKWHHLNADMLNGTDGTIYSPLKKRCDYIESFNSDMCR